MLTHYCIPKSGCSEHNWPWWWTESLDFFSIRTVDSSSRNACQYNQSLGRKLCLVGCVGVEQKLSACSAYQTQEFALGGKKKIGEKKVIQASQSLLDVGYQVLVASIPKMSVERFVLEQNCRLPNLKDMAGSGLST